MFDKDMIDKIRAQEIALGNPSRHDYDPGAFENSPLYSSGVLKKIRELVPLEEEKDDTRAD